MSKVPVNKSLLDCWEPPQFINERVVEIKPVPIAFFSSSYTFDAEFFEEECLTRFLTMETEKENDGAAFLIEREEKLAGLRSGIVMVDQAHCRGSRSLRWHLVPCRVKNGIMHAKISILHWSDCIRLIIGSANLTKSGYCINQEVFSCIDYYQGSEADLKLINNIMDYLQSMADDFCGATVMDSFTRFRLELRATLKKWGISEAKYRNDDLSLTSLLVSPRERNALVRLRDVWDNHFNSPPDGAYISSPFYDNEASPTTPSIKIFEILQQRGGVEVGYNLTGEYVSEDSTDLILNAPEFLGNTYKDNQEVGFRRIIEEGVNEKGKMVPRPLHLKSIWLAKGDYNLYMIGSSNFTSAALGLGRRANYEANLVYCIDRSRNRKAYDLLDAAYPEIIPVDGEKLIFRQRPNEDDLEGEAEFPNLPLFFKEAIIRKLGNGLVLEMQFDPNASMAPALFNIWYESRGDKKNKIPVFAEADWKSMGKNIVTIEWKSANLPDGLMVDWNGTTGAAFWPVVIESQVTLPPVDILRDLPLEALLQILSSSQPLYRLLDLIGRIKRGKNLTGHSEVVVDAHQLVDTSKFLLQRTRRISYAMKALRNRLEKPAFTRESLEWRLYGPIGVQSLKEAIFKEAKTEEEKQFLLAEMALEISRVNPQQTTISLKKEDIKSALREILIKMSHEFNNTRDENLSPVIEYSRKAIKKAIYEL